MVKLSTIAGALWAIGIVSAQCPYANPAYLSKRDDSADSQSKGGSRDHMKGYDVDDSFGYMTSDVGGPFSDQESLKAGERGPTLLEDFIFRQKITHFDHERVSSRPIHHDKFESLAHYGGCRCLSEPSMPAALVHTEPLRAMATSATSQRRHSLGPRARRRQCLFDFPPCWDHEAVQTRRGTSAALLLDCTCNLAAAHPQTSFSAGPTNVLISYTDEGNFDIVGNNAPVFFIQDAINFPDLVHSLKPESNNEIPQASTAHDTAWDFFSQQTTALHALFWGLSGHGVPRSFRHMVTFSSPL